MTIEFSIALIAIAFSVLAIVLVLTLIELKKTLSNANLSIKKIDLLLTETNFLMSDIAQKSIKLNSTFDAMSHLGDSLNRLCDDPKEEYVVKKKLAANENLSHWIDIAAAGVLIWQKLKKRR